MKNNLHKHVAYVYDAIAGVYQQTITQHTDHLDDFLALLPSGASILDAGCGIGTDAGYMSEKGHRVCGLDLSPGMLEIAEKTHPRVTFCLQDLQDPDFPARSFHGVVASFSLIHIRKNEVIPTLQKYHQLLMPEGLIFLALQSGRSQEVFLEEPYKPDETTFLNIFSLDEVQHVLRGSGFIMLQSWRRRPDAGKEFDFTKLFVVAQKQ